MKTMALVLLLLGLAACGKMGPISPPGPASDVIYPKSYPAY